MATKKSTTRRVLWIVGILVIVLVVLGVAGWAAGFIGNGEEGIEVQTADAERRTITQVVTAFGRAQPEVEVTISPDVSGEITELPITEGDPVQEGQLLARIKPDNYIAQVEQAQATLKSSQADLAQRKADLLQAEREYERQKTLFDRNVIPKSNLEEAETRFNVAQANYEAAQFQVENARARLEEARKQLAKTEIYAPMDGTISMLNVEAGERVVGTTQMAGTEMMRIARLDQMEMEVDVNENDVVNIALDDTAAIEIDAYPEQTFKGRVTEIANSARIEGEGTQEQVTNFPVKVRLLDQHNMYFQRSEGGGVARQEVPGTPEEALTVRPGMSGAVDIFTRTVDDVVAVPIQAVTVRDFNKQKKANGEGGESEGDDEGSELPQNEDLRKVVFLAEADSVRMVEVATGISDDTHIEIRSGLSGGEAVVIGPYSAVSRELEPGAKINTGDEGEEAGGPQRAGI